MRTGGCLFWRALTVFRRALAAHARSKLTRRRSIIESTKLALVAGKPKHLPVVLDLSVGTNVQTSEVKSHAASVKQLWHCCGAYKIKPGRKCALNLGTPNTKLP